MAPRDTIVSIAEMSIEQHDALFVLTELVRTGRAVTRSDLGKLSGLGEVSLASASMTQLTSDSSKKPISVSRPVAECLATCASVTKSELSWWPSSARVT